MFNFAQGIARGVKTTRKQGRRDRATDDVRRKIPSPEKNFIFKKGRHGRCLVYRGRSGGEEMGTLRVGGGETVKLFFNEGKEEIGCLGPELFLEEQDRRRLLLHPQGKRGELPGENCRAIFRAVKKGEGKKPPVAYLRT